MLIWIRKAMGVIANIYKEFLRQNSGKADEKMLMKLAKAGEGLVREIVYSDAEYTTQTANLDDSFGYGVYHCGKMVYHGFLTPSKDAAKPRRWYHREIWGRSEIEAKLKAMSPSGTYALVLYAAMPYASALENASSGQKRKYRVISTSYNHLEELRKQLGDLAKHAEVQLIH